LMMEVGEQIRAQYCVVDGSSTGPTHWASAVVPVGTSVGHLSFWTPVHSGEHQSPVTTPV
jgi:hypothetical protein